MSPGIAALPESVLTSSSSSEVEHPEDSSPLRGVPEDSEFDTMPYPYPRYNEDADAY